MPRPASQARTAPTPTTRPGRATACRECGHGWTTTAAPGNTVRCPSCGYAQRLPLPSAPRPSQTIQEAAAQTQARPGQPTRQDQVCILVRSFGGPLLVWYDAQPGRCEVLDTQQRREDQRCQRTVTRAVVFHTHMTGGALPVYSCAYHADPLAQQAAHAMHVRAEVRALR